MLSVSQDWCVWTHSICKIFARFLHNFATVVTQHLTHFCNTTSNACWVPPVGPRPFGTQRAGLPWGEGRRFYPPLTLLLSQLVQTSDPIFWFNQNKGKGSTLHWMCLIYWGLSQAHVKDRRLDWAWSGSPTHFHVRRGTWQAWTPYFVNKNLKSPQRASLLGTGFYP